jgi:kinetochore protein Mis12/MTW1
VPGDEDTDAASAETGKELVTPTSWRRERAEYIESSSRKYLETVAGLELGPRGELRDGEWQGEGRGLNKGEVEGLEKVAALLETGDQMDTT